jgi:arylsulfatase A-like enzyme
VGTLVADLQDMELMRRTVIAVISDHGEAFREHGTEGHATTLYTEVAEVPILFYLPFRFEKPVVVHERVQNIDVLPTILELVGLPALPGAQGISLVPLIEAAARGEGVPADAWKDSGERTTFAELDRTWGSPDLDPNPMISVTKGPWRFIEPIRFPDRASLYDHRSDPREQDNVLEQQPELVAQMRAERDRYFALPDAPWGKPSEVQIDRMRLEQLRALGYDIGGGETVLPDGMGGHRFGEPSAMDTAP